MTRTIQRNNDSAKLRVLFDLVHPAQVHFFRFFIRKLQDAGHDVLVTAREKDITLALLDAFQIEFVCISKKAGSLPGMAWELAYRDWRLWRIAREFKPDVMVSRVGVSVGPVGKLMGVPTVIFDDMEHARLQANIGLTFATYICTGLGYYRDFGKRHVRYRGPQTLSYMAPLYFEPNPKPLIQAGLDPAEPFIFVRLVSWKAAHDLGREFSGAEDLRRIIKRLEPHGRIIISSEERLPDEFSKYENPVPIDRVHDLIAFARLCFVESGSMACEAVVLGVPTICLNMKQFNIGVINALEREYELLYQPATLAEALDRARELLERADLRETFRGRARRMLDESDDLVEFMMEMIQRAVREHPVRGRTKT